MKSVMVKLKENSYPILIGHNTLLQLGTRLKSMKLGADAFIVSNAAIARRYVPAVAASLKRAGIGARIFLVPEGEKSKSAAEAFRLIERIAPHAAFKKPFIIALGGGVIGDLAGYVAASFRRGIPYVQVPTSFLAQIDSAIGGKVGIDLPCGKNLVGAFYQPKLVFSDVRCLTSLPARQLRNGLAEAIKYGIIADASLFAFIEKNHRLLLNADVRTLTELVERASRIKANIVAADEKETKGIRSFLNFGHTLGHAIEAAGGYDRFQHGEAIALGMRMATEISVRSHLLGAAQAQRINDLISAVGLPKTAGRIGVNPIFKAMRHDKKFLAGKNRFVLATKIGRVKLVSGVSRPLIEAAIKKYSI
jgi:3-dehydroquinate synthase